MAKSCRDSVLLWWLCVVMVVVVGAENRVDIPADEVRTATGAECPVVPSLLQMTGFSPSCVASALAVCSQEGGCQVQNQVIQELQDTLQEVKTSLKKLQSSSSLQRRRPRHCLDLLKDGDTVSGVKQVFPNPHHPDASATVYCDQSTDEGGWLVFQRRNNLTTPSEREDFYRTWVEYQLGFGRMEGEFWLGLDLLHLLTSSTLQEMRIDLHDYEGEHRWAKYGYFHIGTPGSYYKINVGRYTGTAGNGLGDGRHNGHAFSTYDADHDTWESNCAESYKGGWWYDKCHNANLNGYQYEGRHTTYADGINWRLWHEYHYSLRTTTMMIRPAY